MGRKEEGVLWLALLLGLVWGGSMGLESLLLDQGTDCNATHYKQSQRCCSKCPPGQKVRTECSGTSGDTVCEPCEGQHFQAGWTKEKYCTPHRECTENVGLVVHAPGTSTRDVECRCQNGTHCSSHECQTCRKNTPCGPGRGVKHEATHERDTVCVDCPNGFFSNISSATDWCQPWSSCEEQNLVKKVNGTPFSDVVCDFRAPPHRDAERTHLLALLPLAAILLLGGIFILWSPEAATHPGPAAGGGRRPGGMPGLAHPGDAAGRAAGGPGGRQGEPLGRPGRGLNGAGGLPCPPRRPQRHRRRPQNKAGAGIFGPGPSPGGPFSCKAPREHCCRPTEPSTHIKEGAASNGGQKDGA